MGKPKSTKKLFAHLVSVDKEVFESVRLLSKLEFNKEKVTRFDKVKEYFVEKFEKNKRRKSSLTLHFYNFYQKVFHQISVSQ